MPGDENYWRNQHFKQLEKRLDQLETNDGDKEKRLGKLENDVQSILDKDDLNKKIFTGVLITAGGGVGINFILWIVELIQAAA